MLVFVMAYQAIDISLNYYRVPATIKSVETDCYIEENYKNKIVVKGTKERAYVECNEAQSLALQAGFSPEHIHTRTRFSYDYLSPVDSQPYSGDYERTDAPISLAVGSVVSVHTSKDVAAFSRTTNGNLFLSDTGI
jgi:hypothetical protein